VTVEKYIYIIDGCKIETPRARVYFSTNKLFIRIKIYYSSERALSPPASRSHIYFLSPDLIPVANRNLVYFISKSKTFHRYRKAGLAREDNNIRTNVAKKKKIFPRK